MTAFARTDPVAPEAFGIRGRPSRQGSPSRVVVPRRNPLPAEDGTGGIGDERDQGTGLGLGSDGLTGRGVQPQPRRRYPFLLFREWGRKRSTASGGLCRHQRGRRGFGQTRSARVKETCQSMNTAPVVDGGSGGGLTSFYCNSDRLGTERENRPSFPIRNGSISSPCLKPLIVRFDQPGLSGGIARSEPGFRTIGRYCRDVDTIQTVLSTRPVVTVWSSR
ncbi:MAG: hypothetical protein QOG44_554 [Acidimicrobiaceae bacterium]|nr:hypothetical protein [Acidimicrobiaceae bacterium]